MPGARPLEIVQLQAHLKVEFGNAFEPVGSDPLQRERNFLSKALAAYFLTLEAGAPKVEAIAASIDGGDDHGIDSVWVSPTQIIWLVQSKYRHSGDGEPSLSEVTKFVDGLRDFIGGKFDRFNDRLKPHLPNVERAFRSGVFQVRAALVYSGTTLGEDRRRQFRDLEERMNRDRDDLFRFQRFGLTDLHEAYLRSRAEPAITEQIVLRDFGLIDAPHRAYFGSMRVADIAALYAKWGHALVQKNIRRYQGASSVNDAIRHTVANAPLNFFYFNNGITFLCHVARRLGPIDEHRSEGRFELENLSIINGAQTAGTIAMEPPAYYHGSPARVLVTVICTEGAEEHFPSAVTEFRNRQNALILRDFAALDVNQEHHRRTLQASGIHYLYKHAADDPAISERVFCIEDAAHDLACATTGRDALDLVVMAAATPDALLDRQRRIDGSPAQSLLDSCYGRLFGDALTARELWRVCQIGRMVKTAVDASVVNRQGAEAEIVRRGVTFLLHLVFTLTEMRDGATLQLTEAERDEVSKAVDAARFAMIDAYGKHAWDQKEPAEVFVNAEDLRDLKAATMKRLQQDVK